MRLEIILMRVVCLRIIVDVRFVSGLFMRFDMKFIGGEMVRKGLFLFLMMIFILEFMVESWLKKMLKLVLFCLIKGRISCICGM